MKRLARFPLLVCPLSTLAAACVGSMEAPADDLGSPECQIQTPAEKSPGYPFDLTAFADDVLPVVTQNCAGAGCHAPPEGTGGFTVWAAAAPGNCDYAKTFNNMSGFVDLANPDNSALLIAVRGDLPTHPVQYDADDPRLAALTAYVQNASARFLADGGGGTTPPPGASPFDYRVFQDVVQPILNTADGKGCAVTGCHLTGAGGMTLAAAPARDSAQMEANFIAITSRTNLTTPETSLVLLKATTRHGGGQSAVVSALEKQSVLDWIVAAAEVGGGGNPGCAPVEKFSTAVFRDEILPILQGDLDLNNPGAGGTTVGCTRGPCHGTDRGPGVLYLSAAADATTNLKNFACFVDLLNPSASEVLLCPLDDPRCRKFPHPGQDVFAGAQDLNYQRVLAYLYGSGVDATPLDFAFFVRRVNPIFNDLAAVEGGAQGRTCAETVSCHGISVVGQSPPNGSNFPILPNAADLGRLTFNFASSASFVNFLDPDDSSLFLYPTNEIADVADHPLATGLPHPGGADFAVDSAQARDVLRWAGGLRPDAQGYVTDWLVAGDYAASLITDPTPIDEAGSTPAIFDPTGALQFNNGQWDAVFSDEATVDLNGPFPRAATNGRVAYAVAYLVNTTGLDITAHVTVTSPNAIRLYVGNALVAQADDAGAGVAAIAALPAYAKARTSTRILIKVLQRAADQEFAFALRLRDEFGNPLTDTTGELVLQLGPGGGI
jgi:hypothetical protein